MGYTELLKKKQEAEAEGQLVEANSNAWRQILREHENVLDSEANFKIVLEFSEGEITGEKFRYLLQEKPAGFDLAFGDDRPKLIAAIMAVIDPKNIRSSESLNSKMSRRAAVSQVDRFAEEKRLRYIEEEKRLKYLDRNQLLDELEKKNLNSQLRSMSPEEIRQRNQQPSHAYLNGYRPQSLRADGYPTLPQVLVIPGEVQARELTPEFLTSLRKRDYNSPEYAVWRLLVKKYGGNQIMERSQ